MSVSNEPSRSIPMRALLIGKNPTPKSLFIRDLLSRRDNHNNSTNILIFHGYKDLQPVYEGLARVIHKDYSDEILKSFLEANQSFRKIIVFDNCFYTNSARAYITNALLDAKTDVIFSVPSLLGLSPLFRSRCNYLVLFGEPVYNHRKRIYRAFLQDMFHDFDRFNKYWDDKTIIVDLNSSDCYKLQD